MHFLYYLPPESRQLVELIRQAKFSIRENISWCRDSQYAGAIIQESKTFFICTSNILNSPDANRSLIETVNHEAAHAAQACKGLKPIGIPLGSMPLSAEKMQNINRSIHLTKKEDTRRLEHEAYWLEDKPQETMKYLQKFCF